MKKSCALFVAIVAIFFVQTASARNVWRECGIGGMLFKETGWAAIISNIIWDLGTTATSSNVSSDNLCEGKSASAARFLHETYAQIEEETAVGSGAHLTAMLNMLGCDSQAHGQIINSVRGDLQGRMSTPTFSNETQLQKAEGYYNGLMSSAATHNCQAI